MNLFSADHDTYLTRYSRCFEMIKRNRRGEGLFSKDVESTVVRGVRDCDLCHKERLLMIYSLRLGTGVMWEPFDTDDVGYICYDCYLERCKQ